MDTSIILLHVRVHHPHDDDDPSNDGNMIRISSSLSQRHGIRSGHRYRVRLHRSAESPSSLSSSSIPWRLCSFHAAAIDDRDGEQEKDVCFMDPQLIFNLKDKTQPLTSQPPQHKLQVDVSFREGPEMDTPFASCVSIGLVTSPDYPGHCDYSLLLSRYFSRIKRIFLHDVVCVPTRRLCPEIGNQMDDVSSFTLPEYVFFKVIQVESKDSSSSKTTTTSESGLLMQKGRTKLIQLPAAKSLIPGIKSIKLFDESILSQLLYIIAPYYNERMRGPAMVIMSGNRGVGKDTAVKCLANDVNMPVYEIDVNHLLLETPAATEKRISDALLKCIIYSPCVTMIQNLDLLVSENKGNEERYATVFKQCVRDMGNNSKSVFIVVTSDESNILKSESFAPLFKHHVNMKDPDEGTRLTILKHFTRECTLSADIDLPEVAKKTSSFTITDLRMLVMWAIDRRNERKDNIITESDLMDSLKQLKHRNNSRSLGAPEIPQVKWSDVGGMDHVKKDIMDTIMIPMRYPHLFSASKLRRVGLLLHGPPGTGKTLIAKAVATECNINFLSIKGPELISMYVGQSEANVRSVFAKARSTLPCVMFFDELDSLAPNRGRAGDSGGVMDRIVSQILAEMDHLPAGLFIIGATNRPDLIDPALLRPGRFDKMIHVDVCHDKESRIKILKALTRKFDVHPDVDFVAIEQSIPERISGADLYAIVSSAMNQSIRRIVNEIDDGVVKEEDASIQLTRDDFDQAVRSFSSLASD